MNLNEPLDIVSTEGQEFLRGIQGNILESHRRDHVALLYLRFAIDDGCLPAVAELKRAEIAKRLSDFAGRIPAASSGQSVGQPGYVNTAAHERGILSLQTLLPELPERKGPFTPSSPAAAAPGAHTPELPERKGPFTPGERSQVGPFFMLALSHKGYHALGLDRIAPRDVAFQRGMRGDDEWVGKRQTEDWTGAFAASKAAPHGLVLVADDDRGRLDALVAMARRSLAPAEILVEIADQVLANRSGSTAKLSGAKLIKLVNKQLDDEGVRSDHPVRLSIARIERALGKPQSKPLSSYLDEVLEDRTLSSTHELLERIEASMKDEFLGRPLPQHLLEPVGDVIAALDWIRLEEETHVGNVLRRMGRDSGVEEHFGYRDGLSQPWFFKQNAGSNGSAKQDVMPLSTVLLEDPGAEGEFGSLMAFQKYEQNVGSFDAGVTQLHKRLKDPSRWLRQQRETLLLDEDLKVLAPESAVSLTEELAELIAHAPAGCLPPFDEEDVRAMVVGRYKDGRPLPKPHLDPGDKAKGNDFDFKDDSEGRVCPFHAHIRKMNHREDRFGTSQLGRGGQPVRIARRGIPYGEKDAKGKGERGLFFMSFQRDLAQFLYYEWAAQSQDFLRAETGVGALLGRASAPNNGEQARTDARQSLADAEALFSKLSDPQLTQIKDLEIELSKTGTAPAGATAAGKAPVAQSAQQKLSKRIAKEIGQDVLNQAIKRFFDRRSATTVNGPVANGRSVEDIRSLAAKSLQSAREALVRLSLARMQSEMARGGHAQKAVGAARAARSEAERAAREVEMEVLRLRSRADSLAADLDLERLAAGARAVRDANVFLAQVETYEQWLQRNEQTWPTNTGGAVRYLFANHVILRGGEFFFAPSMAVLGDLPRLVKQAPLPATVRALPVG